MSWKSSVGKNEEHRIGGPKFLNKDAKFVIPYVVDAIRVRAERGVNPIYIKSAHLVEDYDDKLKQSAPEFYKKGKVYSKQIYAKTLRVLGFDRKATNHKDSAFILKW